MIRRHHRSRRAAGDMGPATLAQAASCGRSRSLALADTAMRSVMAMDPPFSQCAFASEFCLHTFQKEGFLVSPQKKGGTGGACTDASTGCRPRRRKKNLPAYCGERHGFLPQTVQDQNGNASWPLGRPAAVMHRRAPYPRNLAPGRASWRSPDPNGRPLSGTSAASRWAVLERAGRWMPGNHPEPRCMAALPGTALVPLSKVLPSRKAPP